MKSKSLKKLIEEINDFANELETSPVVDEFDGAEIDGTDATLPQETLTDTSATDKLAAKTKISRAFDVLKDAFNDFQNQIVDSVDLAGDNDILQAVDALSNSVTSLQSAIDPNAEQMAPMEMDYQGFDDGLDLPMEDEDLGLGDEFDFESDEFEDEADDNGLADDELEKDFDSEATVDIDDEIDELEDSLEEDEDEE